MHRTRLSVIQAEKTSIDSEFLSRNVKIDCYRTPPGQLSSPPALLLLNDGQDMEELGFASILENFMAENSLQPIFCAAIHAGQDRKMEYGIAGHPDFKGRGAKAGLYTSFVLHELIPYLRQEFSIPSFREKSVAGFSLGGLMALDLAWSNPDEFSRAGVFSGSFWWRSVDQSAKQYDDDQHRLIHQKVRKGIFHPQLSFFFQCGNLDETKDRNNNGIIDSIDDTLDLIRELEAKGYRKGKDIHYLELPDGRHDIATWARAMPVFLQWGWGSR